MPPPERPVAASYRLVCSFTSSSVSGAGLMLSVSDPSFEVKFVASMPLKNRLVLVVRVPLTDGEMFPVPFTSTGGSSALTPASDDNRCVKLRVVVGTSVSSSALSRRNAVDVVGVSSSTPPVTVIDSLIAPISSVTLTLLGTPASTRMLGRTCFLKEASSNVNVYSPGGSVGNVHSPWPPVTAVRVTPACGRVAVTVTPGRRPPAASLTRPVNVPVEVLCAAAGRATSASSPNASPTILKLVTSTPPSNGGVCRPAV